MLCHNLHVACEMLVEVLELRVKLNGLHEGLLEEGLRDPGSGADEKREASV